MHTVFIQRSAGVLDSLSVAKEPLKFCEAAAAQTPVVRVGRAHGKKVQLTKSSGSSKLMKWFLVDVLIDSSCELRNTI